MFVTTLRRLHFFGFTAFALAGGVGCSAATDGEIAGASDDAIVDVDHTPVERQLIGNCWIYAHATWAEAMHKRATGVSADVSQSYWTYWHWYDQITGRAGWGVGSKISTGGTWTTANGIVGRNGLMLEADFLPDDGEQEGSNRQATAESRINEMLAPGGLLGTRAAQRDGRKVRIALDVAWGLREAQRDAAGKITGAGAAIGPWAAKLDAVFGADGKKAFNGRGLNVARPGNGVARAQDFAAAYPVRSNGTITVRTASFATAITEWRERYYSAGSRAFHQGVQRALHEQAPVILTWDVDFNALSPKFLANGDPNPDAGQFRLEVLRPEKFDATKPVGRPGRQGGHMVVLEDYEAKLSDGEVLKAGVTLPKGDPRLRRAAEESGTEIVFYRVKNSWGTTSARGFVPGFAGYHDLYMNYLDGPIESCSETENAVPYEERGCVDGNVPLSNVVLPPGF